MARRYLFLFIVICLGYALSCHADKNKFSGQNGLSPYLQSSAIKGVDWDMSTHRRLASGSDNWPTTWADDGAIYTAWGDGGGFGGTNIDGRVSLGVAKVEGDWDNYRTVNVWGGKNGLHPAQFKGKSYGLLSVEGTLYMAFFSQDGVDPYRVGQIAYSNNYGATFHKAVTFSEPDVAFAVGTFLNFGQDYSNSRDEYVYLYAGQTLNDCIDRCIGKDYYLARVQKDSILMRDKYEFFKGVIDGLPAWTKNILERKPVFSDNNGASVRFGVIYNPGLKRYILSNSHNNRGGLGIFDAPEPWGPWTTVAYYDNWLDFGYSPSYHIAAQKWMSADGMKFTMIWSSRDCWNTMRGAFITP